MVNTFKTKISSNESVNFPMKQEQQQLHWKSSLLQEKKEDLENRRGCRKEQAVNVPTCHKRSVMQPNVKLSSINKPKIGMALNPKTR